MSDLRQETVNTYNRSAESLAEYFRGIGPRTEDIDIAFRLAGNPSRARVLEIGCGDGRDAKAIAARSGWYYGIDIAEAFVDMARQQVPDGTFEVADAVTFEYPAHLNIVFAFASLLHLDKTEVQTVCQKVHTALRPGGIFYISLKERPEYAEEIKQDEYGSRLFYFYNAGIIKELAGEGFQTASLSRKTIGSTDWFEVALQKR